MLTTLSPAVSQRNTDSLRQLLSQDIHDTARVNVLNSLSRELYDSETDSSLILARQAASLSQRIDYKKGLSYAYHNQGTNFSNQGDLDSAQLYFEKSLAIKRELGDSIAIAGTLNNLAGVYFFRGNYAGALYYFQQALTMKLAQGDTLRTASTLKNIGMIYSEQANDDLALDYFNRSLEIREATGNLLGQASTLVDIGLVYLNQKDYSKALAYQTRAFELYDSLNNRCRSIYPAINIGTCYRQTGELDLALTYLNTGYTYAMDCERSLAQAEALLQIARVHAAQSKNQQAEAEMLESYEIAINHDLKEHAYDAAETLHGFYRALGNTSQALKYLETCVQLKDGLFSQEITEQLTTMELNFSFQQERDSMEHQKQKELFMMNASLEKQLIFQYLTGGGLLLASIFIFILYRNYRLNQLANLNLRKKNEMQQEKLSIEASMRKQLELENNKKARTLTATSMQLLNFNEKLSDVITQVRRNIEIPDDQQLKMIKELDGLRNEEDHWNNIRVHFENVHPDFFRKLELHFPSLSSNDYKILTYLKMKLSNKEIAIILNVTTRAVEQSKRRLKKKLGMESNDNDFVGYIIKHTQDSHLMHQQS